MTTTDYGPSLATAGDFGLGVGFPGQVRDTSETVIDSLINTRTKQIVVGTADVSLSSLYGSGGSLSSLTLIVSALVSANATTYSTYTLTLTGSVISSPTALVAAIGTTLTGVTGAIAGASSARLLLESTYKFNVGGGTANTLLGLTTGTASATSIPSIEFGVAVAQTGERTGAAALDDNDKFVGISVRDPYARAMGSDNTIDYSSGYAVPILKFGYVYAKAAETAAAWDRVVILTAGNTTVPVPGALGSATGGAAGTTGRCSFVGEDVYWVNAVTAGSIGLVRITL